MRRVTRRTIAVLVLGMAASSIALASLMARTPREPATLTASSNSSSVA